MTDRAVIVVREERPPVWALLAPALYLLACAGCIRSALLDRSMDIGIAGLLVAVGLAPAFAIPAVFATRSVRLAATGEGLRVDGRLVKVSDIRIARAHRGAGHLTVETRSGTTRTFVVPSYKDAQRVMAMLPPASAPTGALAA